MDALGEGRAAENSPRLTDYELARATSSWKAAAEELAGLPGGHGLNIAYEAVDRHVAEGRGSHIALRWIARGKATADLSYAELAAQSARVCNGLARLGIDRVFTLLNQRLTCLVVP